MTTRAKDGEAGAAPNNDLSNRLASAAIQAIRKTHAQTRAVPARIRPVEFRVTFDDGRRAFYRLSVEFVREVAK